MPSPSSSSVCIFIISIIAISHTITFATSQCGLRDRLNKRDLCCSGHNASCYRFEVAGNKQMGRKIKCFCDQHCLRTNDCCSDYTQKCGHKIKVDCLMSNWSSWSQCSVTCGRNGVKKRKRCVIVKPSSGGKRCGPTQQIKACQGKRTCPKPVIRGASAMRKVRWNYYRQREQEKIKRHRTSRMETIHILPETSMSKQLYKKYNRKNGIVGHLPSISKIPLQSHQSNSGNKYCVKYEVTYASPNCPKWHQLSKMERPFWFTASCWLKAGQQLCLTLSCDYPSSFHNRCYGNQLVGGFNWLSNVHKWRAIRSDNCYGYFKMVQGPQKCQCSIKPSAYLII